MLMALQTIMEKPSFVPSVKLSFLSHLSLLSPRLLSIIWLLSPRLLILNQVSLAQTGGRLCLVVVAKLRLRRQNRLTITWVSLRRNRVTWIEDARDL